MPAKAAPKAAAGPALPTPEDEVELPEGLAPPPDPSFTYALAHVTSHAFGVEAGGEEAGLREFDPLEVLLVQLRAEKEAAEPTAARSLIAVEREELETLAEGGTLAAGLRKKVEAEAAFLRRKKLNAARNKAITAADAGAEGEQPAADAESEEANLDLVLMLVGYPSTKEELQELGDEGIWGVADAWVSVHLAGESLSVEPPAEGSESPPLQKKQSLGAPEVLQDFRTAILAAGQNDAIATCTVTELYDCQNWAIPPSERTEESGEPADVEAQKVRSAILASVKSAAMQRLRFGEWLETLPKARIAFPESKETAASLDTKLYERLASAVDSSHHDVPLLLYCMCEQVALTLKGDSPDSSAVKVSTNKMQAEESANSELAMMERFLDNASELLLLGDDAPKKIEDKGKAPFVGSLIDIVENGDENREEQAKVPEIPPQSLGVPLDDAPAEDMVLPYQDRVGIRHAGDVLPGGASASIELERILSHLRAAGVRRLGFPEQVPKSAAARSANRNRIYRFMPRTSVVELERLMMLHEFENLLHAAQPERQWDLKDRVFHERIQASILCQALLDASRREYFIDSTYLERQDCILVAMHQRALPGRVLWHSWEGDLMTLVPREGAKAAGDASLFPMPTFNDWWQLISGKPSEAPPQALSAAGTTPATSRATSKQDPASRSHSKASGVSAIDQGESSQPELPMAPSQVMDIDAREVGYCKAVEKVMIPSDGSVILRTALQRGVVDSIPDLTRDGEMIDVPPPPVEDPKEEGSAPSPEEEEAESDSEEEEIDPRLLEYVPTSRRELRTVKVVKDSMNFGMVRDQVWQKKADALKKQRLEKEQAEAEAAAAAEAEAAPAEEGEAEGIEPEEKEEPPEAKEGGEEDSDEESAQNVNITERSLEDSFGRLWIAFVDGARCTVRMQHEMPWYMEGDTTWDSGACRPGVQVSYTAPSGLVVQAFSDAFVRQSWPLQRLFPSNIGDVQDAQVLWPGQAEDLEVARGISAFGVLVVERLSGRKEVYHPNGTRGWRNPTIEELQARRDEMQASKKSRGCDEAFHAMVRRLEGICAAWEDKMKDEEPMDPSEESKYFGMPGHWRITTAEGRRFGRTQSATKIFDAVHMEEQEPSEKAPTGSQQASKQPTPRGDADERDGEDGEESIDQESDQEPLEAPPELHDVLEALFVDEGENLEYELDPVPTFSQRDPHTGQRFLSNDEGMLILVNEDGKSNVCLLNDGTKVFNSQTDDGFQVIVEKETAARVTCQVHMKAYNPNSMMKVDIEDGASMDVVPRRMNMKAELVPSDPVEYFQKLQPKEADSTPGSPTSNDATSPAAHAGAAALAAAMGENRDPREANYSTNASVLLRRPDGQLIHSKGAGEVELISNFDVATMGEEQAIKTVQDRGNVYLAHLDMDRITMRDDDGNTFEIFGDQTVDFKLSVSMGDDFASPRCTLPRVPFKHPDASFLPLPEEAPPPRLFIVYGDGEAEELLLTRDVKEALRLAKNHPDCMVTEGEPMGWPMNTCKSHTIHRILPLDPVGVPMRQVTLPTSIAGFADTPAPQRTFTEFRQFIEYPAVSEEVSEAWAAALAAYAAEEEKQRQKYEVLGAGLKRVFSKQDPPADGYPGDQM